MPAPATPSRPAFDLLLACAVWEPSERQLETIRTSADARVHWQEWFELIHAHRLVPHAQRALGAVRALSPPDVAEALMKETVTIAARSLARTQQLSELLNTLDADGVRALPFQGPALSLAAYDEPGVRDSADLDIVVRPDDIDAARASMQRAGYTPRTERMLKERSGHFVFAAPNGGAAVELHWRFALPRYPWSIPAEEVFSRAVTIDLEGRPTASPDAVDQLLLQLMHGARHQWERLEWLVAFAQLLKRVSGHEEILIGRAEANGSSRALSLALRLAHDVLGAPLAPGLATLAGEERSAARAAQIVGAIETAKFSADQPYVFNGSIVDRGRDQASYIALLLRRIVRRIKSLFVRR